MPYCWVHHERIEETVGYCWRCLSQERDPPLPILSWWWKACCVCLVPRPASKGGYCLNCLERLRHTGAVWEGSRVVLDREQLRE